MAKRKLVYEVRDGQAGYFLIAAPSEGEAKSRARKLGITVVSIKQHVPRPWRATDERTEVRTG